MTTILVVWTSACGGGSGPPPPPPPPPIGVSVMPPAANVFLGAMQAFTAAVTNTANTAVTWSVSGTGCAGAQCGAMDANGMFTAPAVLPSNAMVTIRATSQADPNRSAAATVMLMSDVAVNVMPPAANVELGAQTQLGANVSGSGNPDRSVTWQVSCGAACGSINGAGLYTAPTILPAPATVSVVARSVADTSKSATVSISVTSNFTLGISGPAMANTGEMAQFSATVTPVPGSNPDTNVAWSVNGVAAGDAMFGMIDNTGFYTAPLLAPAPNTVTITATSQADLAKSASTNLSISNVVSVFLSPTPSVNVALEEMQQFMVTVAGTPNTSVIWDVNGIVGGDQSTVGAITQAGLYFAPVNKPAAAITVRATSQADPAESASTTVVLFSNIQIQIAPPLATRAINHRLALSISVANTQNPGVVWRVNGVAGGSAADGFICVAGFNPCQPITGPSSDPTVEYLAPAGVAGDTAVTVTATSAADPDVSAQALITVIPALRVSVLPASSTLPANGAEQFFAVVAGTDEQRVTWTVNGIANGDATVGSICVVGSNPCAAPTGPLAGAVEYRAPAASPGAVTVTATSFEDPARSGSGTLDVTTGPFIQTLRPSAITAADGNALTLQVQGLNFQAGGSILFDGTARAANCSATLCTTQLSSADFNTEGDRAVQVEVPGSPAVRSNQVVMQVVAAETTESIIALPPGSPTAADKDILVVESLAANAGGLLPDIEAIGFFLNNSCSAVSNSISATRPASGTLDVDICLTVEGPGTGPQVSISGPAANDIVISGVQNFGLFVVMRLTLSSTTQPGLRTVFLETSTKEKAAASGAIEVK